MARAIIKDETRILNPWEEEKLYLELNTEYQIITRAMLHTYMRMPELFFLIRHQDCYHASDRCIDLPREAHKKYTGGKATVKERTIPLTKEGCKAIEELFDKINKGMDIPTRQAMTPALQLAARKAQLPDLDKGVCPKMYRKVMLSWLVEVYPEKLMKIAKSAGHSAEIMEKNYIGIFTVKRDIDEMRVRLAGWGEA
jgi:integrase